MGSEKNKDGLLEENPKVAQSVSSVKGLEAQPNQIIEETENIAIDLSKGDVSNGSIQVPGEETSPSPADTSGRGQFIFKPFSCDPCLWPEGKKPWKRLVILIACVLVASGSLWQTLPLMNIGKLKLVILDAKDQTALTYLESHAPKPLSAELQQAIQVRRVQLQIADIGSISEGGFPKKIRVIKKEIGALFDMNPGIGRLELKALIETISHMVREAEAVDLGAFFLLSDLVRERVGLLDRDTDLPVWNALTDLSLLKGLRYPPENQTSRDVLNRFANELGQLPEISSWSSELLKRRTDKKSFFEFVFEDPKLHVLKPEPSFSVAMLNKSEVLSKDAPSPYKEILLLKEALMGDGLASQLEAGRDFDHQWKSYPKVRKEYLTLLAQKLAEMQKNIYLSPKTRDKPWIRWLLNEEGSESENIRIFLTSLLLADKDKKALKKFFKNFDEANNPASQQAKQVAELRNLMVETLSGKVPNTDLLETRRLALDEFREAGTEIHHLKLMIDLTTKVWRPLNEFWKNQDFFSGDAAKSLDDAEEAMFKLFSDYLSNICNPIKNKTPLERNLTSAWENEKFWKWEYRDGLFAGLSFEIQIEPGKEQKWPMLLSNATPTAILTENIHPNNSNGFSFLQDLCLGLWLAREVRGEPSNLFPTANSGVSLILKAIATNPVLLPLDEISHVRWANQRSRDYLPPWGGSLPASAAMRFNNTIGISPAIFPEPWRKLEAFDTQMARAIGLPGKNLSEIASESLNLARILRPVFERGKLGKALQLAFWETVLRAICRFRNLTSFPEEIFQVISEMPENWNDIRTDPVSDIPTEITNEPLFPGPAVNITKRKDLLKAELCYLGKQYEELGDPNHDFVKILGPKLDFSTPWQRSPRLIYVEFVKENPQIKELWESYLQLGRRRRAIGGKEE